MKKMTGFEYKAFIKSDWDTLLGLTGAYMDGQEITVNGGDEPEGHESIADDAKVIIHCGAICASEDIDMSLETAFSRWKKAQTSTVLMVEIPNDAVEKFTKAVKDMKGKVLK